MKATASPVVSPQESVGVRLRNFVIGSAFAVVLLIPKLLSLRRNPQTWMAFRILLALAGASLIIVPLSFATSWFAAILGLAMFLAAILLPPAKAHDQLAEKARELGALIVINGGEYQPRDRPPAPLQLLVSPDYIIGLNSELEAVVRIPIAEITSVTAAESRDRWIVRVRWMEQTEDFEYQGIFAEHLARVAESTIRSALQFPLPILRQRRAAGA